VALPGSLRSLIHPLYRSLETRACVLRYLFVEITQRCNLACLHCGSDCGHETRLDELSTEEWLRFFDYLPSHFDTERLVLVVTGGEPFCCPRFEEILGGLAKNRLTWGMVTNGWALTDANAARVVEAGIASMTVSLDGIGPTHDWLRGRQGSYERAIAGIRRMIEARLPFFDVVTCVNPRNLDELPKILETLQSLGVKAWRLFNIFPKGRAKQNAELRLSDGQLRQLFDWIRDARARLVGSDFQLQFSCEGYLPPQLDRQVRDEPYFCRAGINIASVLADGSISACPNITRSLVQGNIRKDDLVEVWEKRFEPFRDRRWMKQGDCASCSEWSRCQGNSLHLWDDEAKRPALCHFKALG
jgi:radical SAM enzyme (rSAM/lipoprotein system)